MHPQSSLGDFRQLLWSILSPVEVIGRTLGPARAVFIMRAYEEIVATNTQRMTESITRHGVTHPQLLHFDGYASKGSKMVGQLHGRWGKGLYSGGAQVDHGQ